MSWKELGAAAVLVLWALPQEASASPAEAAAEAADVVESRCSDVESLGIDGAADALVEVSDAWKAVNAAFEANRTRYLLYWRGRLAQCAKQEDRARADYQEFVSAAEPDDRYADLVHDARKRLQRLQRLTGGAATFRPGVLVGALTGSFVALPVSLAVWQNDEAHRLHQIWHSGSLQGFVFEDVERQLRSAEDARDALLVAAGGLAAGAVGAFVADGVQGRRVVTVVAVPRDGGFVVALGGRW